jgi:RNA polymerase sigma-70 factor (ECF subfamily)
VPVRDDAALWLAGRTDPDAFAELFERHARAVFVFCAQRCGDLALADDLTSAVFLEAWRKRRSVELTAGSALPWLLGTANNVVRNANRSLRRHSRALARLPRLDIEADFSEAAADRLDAQREFAAAQRAIESLPAGEREVATLVLWGGASYADAARALAVPIGTVRSRVSRARTALERSLGGGEAGE